MSQPAHYATVKQRQTPEESLDSAIGRIGREAIAYFATSLDFDVRPRQAKSEIYDRSFRKMCRSVHEHPVRAEVGRADWDLASPAFIAYMEFAQMLNSRFATSRLDWMRSVRARFFKKGPLPSTWSDDLALESDPPGPRRVPQ